MLGDWGKYRLESNIACGGMAEIFKARSLGPAGFSKPVCIKRVLSERSNDPEFVEMFEREARIAAALQHPNIVQVFDFDRHDGRLFLVMEYVEGLDLKRVLKETAGLGLRLPVEFVLHVMKGLLSALGHAHEYRDGGEPLPVIHRDVSPHNILLSEDGFVKLADFGIAKALGGTSATSTGVLKGKLAYIAPEQAAGEEAGPRTDLYSAGIVLWEMLSGRRLFEGKTEQEILAKVLQAKTPEPLPGHNEGVKDFVQRLLAWDPAQRFPSAGDALDALAELDVEPCSDATAGSLVKALMALNLEECKTGLSTPPVSILSSSENNLEEPKEESRVEEEDDKSDKIPTRLSQSEIALPSQPSKQTSRRFALPVMILILGIGLGAGFSFLGRGPAEPTEGLDLKGQARADTISLSTQPEEEKKVQGTTDKDVVQLFASTASQEDSGKKEAEVIDGKGVEGGESGISEQHANRESIQESAAKTGYLQVNCRPWAKVFVDGRDLGTTPLRRTTLSVGGHKVVLKNEELGFSRTYSVKIRPGKTTKLNKQISTGG